MSHRGGYGRRGRGPSNDRQGWDDFSHSSQGGFGSYNRQDRWVDRGNNRGYREQTQSYSNTDGAEQFSGWRNRQKHGVGGSSSQAYSNRDQEKGRFSGNYDDDDDDEEEDEDAIAARGNKPPPHLRGRAIGMWYARRSQARKEKKEKTNRSTVSMDKSKEKNIRDLLDTLKDGDDHDSSHTTSPQSSKRPWHNTTGAGPSWGSGASYKRSNAGVVTAIIPAVSSNFLPLSNPFPVEVVPVSTASSTSNTTFVYADKEKETDKEQNDPPDSWEMRSDDGRTSGSDDGAEFPEVKSSSQEDLVDLDLYNDGGDDDDDDDDDKTTPSVTGVVEYMMSHGDYPYGAESDFAEALTESDNPLLDREMSEHMLALASKPGFVKMLGFRKKLPSYSMREQIVSTIDANQVLVISGETGCGKTTQVPQFILDSYIERGVGSQCRIICTQPRRISAISVAERVAAERCEKVNDTGESSVGYQIRLETKRPRTQGSILFCTTGIVLKFLEGDPGLNRATHIIIDEIHERDLQSDFLMIILKDLLLRRTNLKVILMSATLNAEMFSQYFDNCPMLNIPGYTFPVKEYLLEEVIEMTGYIPDASRQPTRRPARRSKPEDREEEEDYQVWCRNLMGKFSHRTIDVLQRFDYNSIDIDLIHHIINHICTKMEDGAILVFVPGWEEIKKLHEMIQKTPRCKSGSLRVIPLHSLMPTVNQREVFDRPPPGVRKIVIATNIAETSITIDDVVFVIDCGKIKVKDFQPEINLTSLEPQWVSKANAKQRRGRAGRVQAGHCFHLYTEFRYSRCRDYLPPEMLRTRLEELCLQIKLLKLGMIVPFIGKAMQHPSIEAIQHAVETLIELQALDRNENLLPLGYHLARMPVEPHTGKMILFGAMFCCLDPILTVAASLSFKDAFTIPLGKESLADQARKQLSANSKSDHIMLINAYRGWEESLNFGNNHQYCWQNFLSENTLKMLRDMKRQLAELLYDIGFLAAKSPKHLAANKNSDSLSMIRAVLCAGLYPNVAQVTKATRPNTKRPSGVKMSLKGDNRVFGHPKSVNYTESFFESKWMVFYHKLKTSKVYIHDCTMVSPYPLLFFGGEIQILQEEGMELVSVDNWVKFKASSSTAQLVKDLRKELDKILKEKITRPGPTSWNKQTKEGALMTTISDLICTEKFSNMDGSIGFRDGKKRGQSWS
ncbi:hypothetical protein PoB_003472000 [Plakobranchus ocellatus]|uniref:RNA helicase n=1 Tax=Plakobranchus ocellatus TaxID=259542 RepID=A0AAV4AJ70_9GAST|nr:hypothetical protein PoB_003472000 [Plakobranchus ocellatus]